MRRQISEYRPLEHGLQDIVVGDEAGHRAAAAFDFDNGWMDVTDPAKWHELRFTPTWFEVVPSRE